jgi:hypothetical protein
MSGAAWKPKSKTPEELFEELVIQKQEYYDLEIPTLEEYRKQQWDLVKQNGVAPNGLAACMGWNLKLEREYKKKYQK